ncbi:unnamed protein product [Acanthocheilonema viteae]|uniref:TPM domain-containing protein n=1 Tax=Acanthocheilonema viteae TaxID=6277 RepID=A0A498SD74_ACAVI|nr:unnamed protein product [Acanthocheilonema viteae]
MQCVGRRTLFIVTAALLWSSVNARRIFAIDSECTSCSYYTTHICISPFLYSEHLVNSIEKQISSRFEPCLNGSKRKTEQLLRSAEIMGRRGTVIVAMVECSSRQNWNELAETASVKWADKLSCHFDALIVLFHQWKLIPVLSIRRNSSTLWRQLQLRSYQVAYIWPKLLPHSGSDRSSSESKRGDTTFDGMLMLRGKYENEEAEQLVDELLSIMDVKARQSAVSTTGEGSKTREHVPNWAFIVIIVSILLSAVAFYIGTCINKKTSWKPFSNGKPKSEGKRRLWGAGFSGGIWGAS